MRLSSILNRLQIARVDKFRHKSESQLPVELTHRILTDFKNAHGTSALHGCSLVCRVWNDICRHYIFHKITIRTDEIVPRLAFLHFTAPHLSEYIRELHIRVFDGYEVLALPEWIPECLTCLKNLYGLYLKGGIIDSSTVAIHQPGLASLLTIPHLRKLTLDGCAFSGQDAVALIRLLSPYTLEELVIQRVRVDNTTRIDDSPSVVTFDALRSLDIQVPYPVLKNARQLECPKLRSAIIRWSGYENWRLPPWIHATLSELTLHLTIVELDRSVVPEPDLGKTIQPTVFNIVIKECDECLDVCSLAKSWIISLPYPDLLRRVTIEITASGASSEIFFPQLADYEVLSRCLQQLRENGRLDFVDLTIEMRGWIDRDLIDATESRELAKLLALSMVPANPIAPPYREIMYRVESDHRSTLSSRVLVHKSHHNIPPGPHIRYRYRGGQIRTKLRTRYYFGIIFCLPHTVRVRFFSTIPASPPSAPTLHPSRRVFAVLNGHEYLCLVARPSLRHDGDHDFSAIDCWVSESQFTRRGRKTAWVHERRDALIEGRARVRDRQQLGGI